MALATILAFYVFNVCAQNDYSEILSGVRIGILHQSGIVVWPVDSSQDELKWFSEKNWRERDRRRRQAEKIIYHSIEDRSGFRPLQDKPVTLVLNGEPIRSIVRGMVRIPAGCGQFEPSWYASTTGHLADPIFVPAEILGLYPDWLPVLVLTKANHSINIHGARVLDDWPTDLVRATTEAKIPLIDSVAIRTKDIWAIYSYRVTEPFRSGVTRTMWTRSDQNFRRLHETETNATIERSIDRASSSSRKPEENLPFYRNFVGRIHALLENEHATIFMTKYQGWESDRGKLELFHNGEFQTLRVDGFDRGC